MKAPIAIRLASDPAASDVMKKALWIVFMISGIFFFGREGIADPARELDFTLPVPAHEPHRRYLGLSSREDFSLGQIQARAVIIEIFSMYCPICQREAGKINTFFSLIQNDPELRDQIRLIGIGAGNSDFEVDFFKQTYKIEFPLFSDPDFSIHKHIGEKGTPHFYGLTLDGKGGFSVFYSQSGEIPDPESFLDTLTRLAGIKGQP